MNKSYRSVWNESLGAWVAASEITSGRGKKSRSGRTAIAATAIALLGMAGAVQGQQKINDGTGTGGSLPNASAILELDSSTRGLLMSRVALTDAATWGLAGATPVEGMVVYNTNASTGANGLQQGLAGPTSAKACSVCGSGTTSSISAPAPAPSS